MGLSEYTAIRKDGTRFPVTLRSAPILRDERIEGLRGIVLDMTAQKQASEAYRSLVENSIQGLVIFQDNRAVLANKAISTISGYSQEEILAAPSEEIFNVIHPEDRDLVGREWRVALRESPRPKGMRIASSARTARSVGSRSTPRWLNMGAGRPCR